MSRKPTKQDRVTVRFDAETLAQLEAMAGDRGMPVAGVVRAACDLYLKDQKLGAELDSVHQMLAGGQLQELKELARVGEDVQLVIALIDQVAKFLFSTAPEVIDRQAAAAIGNKRHANFIADIHHAFHTRRRKAVLTETLEAMDVEPASMQDTLPAAPPPGDDAPEWVMGDEQEETDESPSASSGDEDRIWLSVPFTDKDIARAAGAKWDTTTKAWYAPPGVDMSELQRWLPAAT